MIQDLYLASFLCMKNDGCMKKGGKSSRVELIWLLLNPADDELDEDPSK